jgi:hypothetical protein
VSKPRPRTESQYAQAELARRLVERGRIGYLDALHLAASDERDARRFLTTKLGLVADRRR